MRSPEDVGRNLLEIIQEIVADQLNIDPSRVVPSANFTEDLGADSLDVVELVMSVEERFDMEIEDIVAGKIATVQDVLDYLIEKRI
jgi:acyl carrier protein